MFIALVVVVWLALMPPLFTHGDCTAEFDAASVTLQRARADLSSFARAQTWLDARAFPYQILTAERCEASPPRDVEVCPSGPTLLVKIPVQNRVCRIYRDGSVHLQLGYASTLELVRVETHMNPFHFPKVPGSDFEIDWAK
jgi:hypothetical protein